MGGDSSHARLSGVPGLDLAPRRRDSLHAQTSEKGEGMRKYSVLLVFGMLAGAAPLAAQWESPTFFAPRPGEDLGLYYVSPAGVNEWGIHGIWRQEGNLSFGVRLGLEENEVFHVGAEFYGPLGLAAPESSLLFSWALGLGASIMDDITWLRVPLGVSIGMNLGSPGTMQLKPYVFPRVAFDLLAIEVGGEEETDTEFNVPIDAGVDVDVGAFVLRGGVTFSLTEEDATSFGAGIALKMPR